MPQARDMIEWALREIAKTNDEGISISLLFERIKSAFTGEPGARDLAWQNLVARNDIVLGDGKAGLALRKLALDDVLNLGLGGTTIKLPSSPKDGSSSREHVNDNDAQATITATVPLIPEEPNPSKISTPTREELPLPKDNISSALESTPTPTPIETPKRRPGRPPKIRPESAPSIAPPVVQPPKRRGRPPKVKPGPSPATASKAPNVEKQQGTPDPQAQTRLYNKSSDGLTGSTATSPQDSNNPADISRTPNTRRTTGRPADTTDSVLTPQSSVGTRSRAKRDTLKNAVFTSWEDMQRRAGITGVYTDYDMSQKRRAKNIFYGAKSIVLVFKSNNLRDSEWLVTHKDSWVETLAARIAQTVIEREDIAQAPSSKRKRMSSDIQPDGSVIESSPKGKSLPKYVEPRLDLSTTVERSGIDEERVSNKRKRTHSIDQLTTQTNITPSKKRALEINSSITGTNVSSEHSVSIPNTQKTTNTAPIQSSILGNNVSGVLSSKTPTVSNHSSEASDSHHSVPRTAVPVEQHPHFPPIQPYSQISPYRSIYQSHPLFQNVPQSGVGIVSNHAYRSPFSAPVGQPTSLGTQQEATSQNPQTYQSPYELRSPDPVESGQPPVQQLANHLWSSRTHEPHTNLARLASFTLPPRTQPDLANTQPTSLLPRYTNGTTSSPTLNEVGSRPAVNEHGPKEGFGATHLNKEEQAQFFSPRDVSPSQIKQRVSSHDASSANGQRPVYAANFPDNSKLSSEAEDATQRNVVEVALLRASSISVQSSIVRLAAVYKDIPGNLLLSENKSTLEFFGLDQHPPQAPITSLAISSMDTHPTMSADGFYPMEIFISSTKDGIAITHCFQFASTPAAYEAARNMRTKLVTGRIAFQFRTGEPYPSVVESEQDMGKPYKCDKCNNRFKNKGGLDYHLTRSQTVCNPNHDPSQAKSRPPRVKKKQKKINSPEHPVLADGQSASEQHAIQEEKPQHGTDKLKKQSSEVSSDSDDSIIEWAEKHATSGLAPVYQRKSMSPSIIALPTPQTSRVPPRSLPGEASLWQDIAEEFFAGNMVIEHPHPSVQSEQYFEQIIIDLVNDNGGLFSGDKGLWFGIVGAWLKRNDKSSNNIPESKICRMAFENLASSGKLQVFSFTFRDSGSRVVTRNIVAVPGADPQSLPFKSIRLAITKAHPKFYVPKSHAPPDTILSRLQSIARRQVGVTNHIQVQGMDHDLVDQQASSSSDQEFIDEEASLAQEYSSDEDDKISDGDEFKPGFENSRKSRKSRRTRPAQATRKRWAVSKASGVSSLSRGMLPITQSRTRTTMQQKLARSIPTALHGWILAAARLPNPKTGAWDQDQIYPKQRAVPVTKPRLPEPITYIQASNGAWTERAFGHGVSPIFSRRPRRIGEFSASADQYQRKINNGFRPIVYRENRHGVSAAPPRSSFASSTSRFQSRALSSGLEKSIEAGVSEHELEKEGSPPFVPEEEEYSGSPPPKFPISKATNRFSRTRTLKTPRFTSAKRRSTLVDDDLDIELVNLPRPSRLGRKTRTSAKAAEELDEIEMLGTFEPKEFGVGASVNPGLRTLPNHFGLGRSVAQIDKHQASQIPQSYQRLQFFDPKPVSESSDFGEGSWTYYEQQIPQKPALKWPGNTTFTVENLPYSELETEAEDIDAARRPTAWDQKRRRTESGSVSLAQRDFGAEKFSKTRSQTALPTDFQGVLLEPTMKATSMFDIQVAKQPAEFHRGQARKMPSNMTPELERRFVAAVTAVQILSGGLEGNIDWVIIANIFSEFSMPFLTKVWGQIRARMPDILEHIAEDFRDAFPAAYERGEVPPIDYDNLTGYDWNSLLDWVTTTVNPTLDSQSVTLPAARRELGQQYHVTESSGDVNNWRDSYFGLLTAIYKRIDMAAAVAATIPTRRQRGSRKFDDTDIDDFAVAKSWVRAAAITPEENWDQRIAAAKLNQLGLPLVEDALQALLGAKVLVHRSKGRALPGRSYEASDVFAAPLRKHITNQQFIDALDFKTFLDSEFFSGEGRSVTIDYMANEGTVMCITSLQAHGRIELVGVDVPMNKFGLTGGGYETKKIPREKLRFRIDIHPTSSYVFDHGNEMLNKIEHAEPPQAGEQGELPAWIGITDAPIADLWKRVLASVSQVVALRAGITLDGLKKVFTPTLEEWELKRFMEWGVEVGIFERLHEMIEGWTAAEWWWLAVAKICEK